MKIILGAAVVLAVGLAAQPAAASDGGQKKYCTRLQQKGGSRLASKRVCLSRDEWRQRLGADWRSILAGGGYIEDAFDEMGVKGNWEDAKPMKPTKALHGSGGR